jgi:hypothetical protein
MPPKDDLIGETDAKLWVKNWIETISENPSIPTDKGTMLAWFSVAIMAGYDQGRRDEKKRDIVEKLREMIFQAGGAATQPLMEDHPDYVFPSERVVERIEQVCIDFGIPKETNAPESE